VTPDVLAYGDDERPPRHLPRPLVALAAVAVLVGGGVAYAHTRDHAHPRATRSFTGYPTETATPGEPIETFDDDPQYADALTVPRPAPNSVTGVLFADGTPGFLVGRSPNFWAVDAAGGPPHARVLVGWCAPLGTFQDAAGTVVYDAGGVAFTNTDTLAKHAVRADPDSGTRVQIAPDGLSYTSPPGHDRAQHPCPAALTLPPLPDRTTDVHETSVAHRLVHGRFVVTTETVAFCAAVRPTGCADQGWERFAPGTPVTLPPGDLAWSYTWEGDFLVHADATDGTLSVIRMPDARLVGREHVGVSVRLGLPHGTYRSGGLLHLRLNPMRHVSGTPGDDSPPGPVEQGWPGLMDDVRGGLRDYVVAPDADIVIGQGVTGLGLPKGTPDTLRRWLLRQKQGDVALWVVLDARGRAIRVVAEAQVFTLDGIPVEPLPPSPVP
jgi:hypothetical protein